MSNEKNEMEETKVTKKQVEQNDPKGAVLKFVKPDMLCGEIHQVSVWQPTVIIDSHMHIQSGHCATRQFVQFQGPLAPVQSGLNFSRGFIEGSGTVFGGLLTLFEWVILKPAKKVVEVFSSNNSEDPPENPQESYWESNALLKLVGMQAKPTDKIAEQFIGERNSLVDNYFKNANDCPLYKDAPYLFFSSIVMTMDMEYSHIDGYFGLRVYNPLFEDGKKIDVTNPSRYWTPAHGKWVKTQNNNFENSEEFIKLRDKTVYKKIDDPGKVVLVNNLDIFNDYKKSVKNDGTIIASCCDPQSGKPRAVSIEALPVLMPESENEKYENWEKQVKFTEEAVLKYPLKFLPMFHYDPRRWQFEGANGNAALIAKVMGVGSLYLGFKMYTAQGFRPWDVLRLPTLEDFYARCCKNGIPILNHCTPGGAKSHEYKEYQMFDHPYDDEKEEKALREGCDEKEYFERNFVSPKAWEKVLEKTVILKDGSKQPLCGLRLCLAHFGGPAEPGPEWSQQIIDMITRDDNKYPNLYTDISSSFADDDFKKYLKKLFTGKLSEKQYKKLRSRILFGTDWYMIFAYGALNKKNLWDYCTESKAWLDSFDTSLWPYFTQYNPYRFYRLETAVKRIGDSIIDMRNRKVYEGLKKLDSEEIEKIYREAAWIKVANKGQESYEEAS